MNETFEITRSNKTIGNMDSYIPKVGEVMSSKSGKAEVVSVKISRKSHTVTLRKI